MLKEYKKILIFFLSIAALILSPGFVEGNSAALHHNEQTKICLTLVVKNEAKVIRRCLNSVKDIVDYICVSDVGSTDDTIDFIEEFMLENGIPGRIFKHTWVNFGHNRTLSIVAAQKVLKEKGFSLNNTYLLTLDADMELKSAASFRKSSLIADSYLLSEKSSSLSCYRYDAHLLRASMYWESIGVMHEYWSHKGPYQNAKLNSLRIDDHGDGDCTGEKRDVKLLTQALNNEPDNPRYLFCLAQTHRRLKNFDEAIKLYSSCIEKNTDQEEVWFSKYMLGMCYEEMGHWSHALHWYLDAFHYNPNRSESLLKIATYYRLRGQNDVACIFAKYGSLIPYSNDQLLFDIPPQTDYRFDEELSIAAYYTHFKEDGYAAASDLLLRRNVPWYIKDQTARNLLFYAENLKNVHYRAISLEFPLIAAGFDERYHPMNPSIQKTESGYKVICRAVNYTQMGAKIFNTIDPKGVYRTRNFLAHYDRDFNLLSQQEIIEDLPRERLRSCNVEGLEDCRIFSFKDQSWFTCTTSDTNPTGERQISLCKLSGTDYEDFIDIDALIPLQGPDPYRCEKNWLPFIKDGIPHVVYSCDPFIIFQLDAETGDCNTAVRYEPSHDLSRFRGSAAPIEFDEGYLMMVHEVVQMHDYSRCYLHRFVYLDKNFIVKTVSRPFTFQHFGIEFCCSMTIDHSGTQLVMAVGVEDREAYIGFVDLSTVRTSLNPLPQIHTE